MTYNVSSGTLSLYTTTIVYIWFKFSLLSVFFQIPADLLDVVMPLFTQRPIFRPEPEFW